MSKNNKKYYCKLCKNRISITSAKYGSGLCKTCAHKKKIFTVNHRKNIGKSKIKHGKYSKDFQNYCVDCHKKISPLSVRCNSCNIKLYWSKKILKRGPNHSNYIDGRTKKKCYCIDCGCQITWTSAIHGNGRCRRCANLGEKNPRFGKTLSKKHLKAISGKNNKSYINGMGYLPYPNKFNIKLKHKIRTRDNFTCQNCGITEEEHLKNYKRRLEIHHIDYNKQNCEKDNLITLCQKCNLKANKDRDYWFAYYKYIIENHTI